MHPCLSSELMYLDVANLEKTELRFCITVPILTLEQVIAKGNLEYSSTYVRKHLLDLIDSDAPLKSRLSLSNGWVTLIRFFSSGLKKQHKFCKRISY